MAMDDTRIMVKTRAIDMSKIMDETRTTNKTRVWDETRAMDESLPRAAAERRKNAILIRMPIHSSLKYQFNYIRRAINHPFHISFN